LKTFKCSIVPLFLYIYILFIERGLMRLVPWNSEDFKCEKCGEPLGADDLDECGDCHGLPSNCIT
jgi:hypothetical protein